MDTSIVLDETKIQITHQFETLLRVFKSTNDQLCTEIDALGGSSSSLGEVRVVRNPEQYEV